MLRCYDQPTLFGQTAAFLCLHSVSAGRFVSPVVVDEGVCGLGIGAGGHGDHAAVHVDLARNVVATEDRRLDVNRVSREENVRPSG